MLDFDYIHAMQGLGDVKYGYGYGYACDRIIEAGDVLFVVKLLSKDL